MRPGEARGAGGAHLVKDHLHDAGGLQAGAAHLPDLRLHPARALFVNIVHVAVW